MFSFYDWADIVLIPLDIKSSLNSGSSVLAFTMGKTVIIPKIGTVRDFPRELMFSYEYENESEHLNALVDKINEAFMKWSDNPKSIERITSLFLYVLRIFMQIIVGIAIPSILKKLKYCKQSINVRQT